MRTILRVLGLALVLIVGAGAATLPAPTFAQATEAAAQPDYDAWAKVADRAEQAVSDGRASTSAFQVLRNELVQSRARFLAAEDINASRIETMNAQIGALGPAPAEGEAEAPEIASRRAELTAQLAELMAPRLRAIEAYNQADGLIKEIDAVIRARETERLLSSGPSPLNPANWPAAVDDLVSTISGIGAEVRVAVTSSSQRVRMRANFPVILALLVAALLSAFRLRNWAGRGVAAVLRSDGAVAERLRSWLDGLAFVLAGTLAVAALAKAVELASLIGIRGQVLLDMAPLGVAVWLSAHRLAPRLLLGDQLAARAPAITRVAGYLAVLWFVAQLISRWSTSELYSDATTAVLNFPIIVLSALALLRLAALAKVPDGTHAGPADTDWSFRESAQRVARLVVRIVAIISPVVAAAGYGIGAGFLVFPLVETLGLVALLLALSAFARDLYGLLRGKDDPALAQSLTPVLINFALVLMAVPFALMFWGVRADQLLELWTRFQEGFQLGATRITPGNFITLAVVFGLGYMLTRSLQSTLRNSVLPKTKLDKGGQTALVSGVGYVGIVIAAFVAISSAGLNLSSLAIVAGALSVGIGFGMQTVVSNFVSGIILLVERPISEGDWIEVGGNSGYVREISVRSTRIETFDRADVILPNSDLISSIVTNYTRGNLIGRVKVPVGVAYGTDTKKVEAILSEIAAAHPMVSLQPPPAVIFMNFGADALEFEVRAILRDVNYVLTVKSDMNHEIARRFAEEGIEVPFAQRDIWLRNPEALAGAGATPKSDEKDKA